MNNNLMFNIDVFKQCQKGRFCKWFSISRKDLPIFNV